MHGSAYWSCKVISFFAPYASRPPVLICQNTPYSVQLAPARAAPGPSEYTTVPANTATARSHADVSPLRPAFAPSLDSASLDPVHDPRASLGRGQGNVKRERDRGRAAFVT